MNREWYDAFLRPDCLVGANTETRTALARNTPFSDNFKQRLRPCMDAADFARLTDPANPAQPSSTSVSAGSVYARGGSLGRRHSSVPSHSIDSRRWLDTAGDLVKIGYTMDEAFGAVEPPQGVTRSAFARRVQAQIRAEDQIRDEAQARAEAAPPARGRSAPPGLAPRAASPAPRAGSPVVASARPTEPPSRSASRARSPVVTGSGVPRPRRGSPTTISISSTDRTGVTIPRPRRGSPTTISLSSTDRTGVTIPRPRRGSPTIISLSSSDRTGVRKRARDGSVDSPIAQEEVARAEEVVERVKRPRNSVGRKRLEDEGYRALFAEQKEKVDTAAKAKDQAELFAIASDIDTILDSGGDTMYSQLRKRFSALRDRCRRLSSSAAPSAVPSGREQESDEHRELKEAANAILSRADVSIDSIKQIAKRLKDLPGGPGKLERLYEELLEKARRRLRARGTASVTAVQEANKGTEASQAPRGRRAYGRIDDWTDEDDDE